MDPNVQRALNDKLYDKRKVGALEYVLAYCAVPSKETPPPHSLPSLTLDISGSSV